MKKDKTFFEFSNILADEMKQLEEKIETFNAQIVISSDHIIDVFDDEKMKSAKSTASFSTITDYTEAVDNNFYNEVDSVFFMLTTV